MGREMGWLAELGYYEAVKAREDQRMTQSTTYQCDTCREVLVQGLVLKASHFGSMMLALQDIDPCLADFRKAAHFCDADCLLKHLRRADAA